MLSSNECGMYLPRLRMRNRYICKYIYIYLYFDSKSTLSKPLSFLANTHHLSTGQPTTIPGLHLGGGSAIAKPIDLCSSQRHCAPSLPGPPERLDHRCGGALCHLSPSAMQCGSEPSLCTHALEALGKPPLLVCYASQTIDAFTHGLNSNYRR